MARVSRKDRVKIWQQRMDRFLTSSQTVAEFCKIEGVSEGSFYQWKRRLAIADRGSPQSNRNVRGTQKNRGARSASTKFAELVVTGPPSSAPVTAQAQLPNGVSICLGGDPVIAATIVERLLAYEPATVTSGARPARRSSC